MAASVQRQALAVDVISARVFPASDKAAPMERSLDIYPRVPWEALIVRFFAPGQRTHAGITAWKCLVSVQPWHRVSKRKAQDSNGAPPMGVGFEQPRWPHIQVQRRVVQDCGRSREPPGCRHAQYASCGEIDEPVCGISL